MYRKDEPHLEEVELDDESDPLLAALTTRLLAALGVVWTLLLYDGLPAFLAWAVSTVEGVDLFAPFTSAAIDQKLGRLGLFLSAVAAIVTTESVTRLARPFGLPQVLLTVSVIGVALFPILASGQQMHLGLTADQFAILLGYSYLVLKVAVGILIGATVSWALLAHGPVTAPAPVGHPTPRK
jgi:hypothetical protein